LISPLCLVWLRARLGPAIIEAILNGQIDPDLSLDSLLGRIPMAWKEQPAIISRASVATLDKLKLRSMSA
jgi:hypothetical protein